MALICDKGPLLAALDAADPDHERCARLLTDADEDLVVPTLVLAELDYWCARRLPPEAWLIFLDDLLAGVYRVESPTGVDLARCRELQARYADLALGVVDASVVALERLGEPKVATLDQRHFRAAASPRRALSPTRIRRAWLVSVRWRHRGRSYRTR
jgi:predicted nucleic acid-binding protein